MASKYSFTGLLYELWNILNTDMDIKQYKWHTTQNLTYEIFEVWSKM